MKALKEDELNLDTNTDTIQILTEIQIQILVKSTMNSTLSSMNQMELMMKTRLRMKKPMREMMMRGFLPYVSESGPRDKFFSPNEIQSRNMYISQNSKQGNILTDVGRQIRGVAVYNIIQQRKNYN